MSFRGPSPHYEVSLRRVRLWQSSECAGRGCSPGDRKLTAELRAILFDALVLLPRVEGIKAREKLFKGAVMGDETEETLGFVPAVFPA